MLLKNEMTIKELEALSGIKAHTIRIWEQRYNIIEPSRTSTNIRMYSNEDLKALLNISFLNRNGFKISKIAKMSPKERGAQVEALFELTTDYEQQVDALTLTMIDLDEARFEKIITKCTIQFGFEQMIEKVIHPFLEKIGVMWMTNTIHPAQEHFITNLIRQKLIVAIDGQPVNYSSDAEKFLLFLPEGEIHELSLLYTNYLLRSHGKHVIYLGLNVPLTDVKAIAELYQPTYLFTIITVYPTQKELQRYIEQLGNEVHTRILVTGAQTRSLSGKLPANITKLEAVSELRTVIDSPLSV